MNSGHIRMNIQCGNPLGSKTNEDVHICTLEELYSGSISCTASQVGMTKNKNNQYLYTSVNRRINS